MTAGLVVDLFAGPGGWDLGARRLGLDPIGIEYDRDTCATRAAAGLRTIRADVRHVPLAPFGDRVDGLIASPPCTALSKAGHRLGRRDLTRIRAELLTRAAAWHPVDPAGWADPVSPLMLEPLRYVHALRPRWVALEQVPEALGIWQTYALVLGELGYGAWCAVANAADYGVPQNRHRAVLAAHLGAQPTAPPRPYASRPVSMAEALGWEPGLVGFPRLADHGEAIDLNGTAYRARDLHPTDGPAPTVTEKARSWSLRPGTYATPLGDTPGARGNRRDHNLDEPAPTIAMGNDAAAWQWVPTALNTGRDWKPGGTREDAQTIPVDQPAPTVSGAGSQAQWTADGEARRVTVAEAGLLQSFPADHPWTGTSSSRYKQAGNAIPPLLAAAVLRAAIHARPAPDRVRRATAEAVTADPVALF